MASFLFHDVADDASTSGFQRAGAQGYKHSREQFTRQLDAITSAPAEVRAVDELDLDPESVAAPAILLTFDDGGASAREIGDTLSNRGFLGHFFITTSMIGSETFLSADDIRSLRSQGHRIGSHSDTHPNIFRDLTPADMRGEWHRSLATLSDILDEPIVMASVPGGDVSRLVYDSAHQAGLRYLFTSEPTTKVTWVGDTVILGRYCPDADTPPDELARLARFEGWSRHLAKRRVKTALKRLGAPAYRRYVEASVRD